MMTINMQALFILLISFAAIVPGFAGEVVKFDDKKPVREMLALVRKEIQKGEKKVVKFTTGEFHLPQPAKEGDAGQELRNAKPLRIRFSDAAFSRTVKTWICSISRIFWSTGWPCWRWTRPSPSDP